MWYLSWKHKRLYFNNLKNYVKLSMIFLEGERRKSTAVLFFSLLLFCLHHTCFQLILTGDSFSSCTWDLPSHAFTYFFIFLLRKMHLIVAIAESGSQTTDTVVQCFWRNCYLIPTCLSVLTRSVTISENSLLLLMLK